MQIVTTFNTVQKKGKDRYNVLEIEEDDGVDHQGPLYIFGEFCDFFRRFDAQSRQIMILESDLDRHYQGSCFRPKYLMDPIVTHLLSKIYVRATLDVSHKAAGQRGILREQGKEYPCPGVTIYPEHN